MFYFFDIQHPVLVPDLDSPKNLDPDSVSQNPQRFSLGGGFYSIIHCT
jgi:hypothetical protein